MINNFGMFSDAGNDAVADIVEAAVYHRHAWAWAYNQLKILALQPNCSEATDTEVREIVYHVLGADKRKEPFYI